MSPTLLQRLKERKLVQWALAYLAGAFVVLQILDAVAEPLSLSVFAQRAVLVLLFIGFLLTLVLAWYHGEKGRQKVSGPELLMVAALLVIAGVALDLLGRDQGGATASRLRGEDDRRSIALLPLDDLSPNPDDAYFADGVHEELTARLSQISALNVISRSSLEQYRDREKRPSIPEMAHALGGVDYLLEGSARVGGGQVRITVQLIDSETDVHVWTNTFDSPYAVEEFIRLQSEIAQEIALALQVEIAPDEEARIAAVPTENLDAYEFYLRGAAAFFDERQRGNVGFRFESTGWYEQAVSLDPEFALAHAGLALTLTYQSAPPLGLARNSAEKALSLVPELPEALLALGRISAQTGRPEDAIEYYQRADQNSSDSEALRELARFQREQGEFDTAISTYLRAKRRDPRNPLIPRGLVWSYIHAHRYEDALNTLVEWDALVGDDSPTNAPVLRTWSHHLKGDSAAAGASLSVHVSNGRGGPWNSPEHFPHRVLLRILDEEERESSFREWAEDNPPCSTEGDLWTVCRQMAVREDFLGNTDRARMLWDSVRVGTRERAEQEWEIAATNALAEMALGNKGEAISAAERGVELAATGNEFWGKPLSLMMLARVLADSGEHDRAIDLLQELLPAPSWLTVHVLEIDPIWDPLRDHPGFQALLEEYADDVEH